MIKIVLVDDSTICLETLQNMCEQVGGMDICGAFTNPIQALSFADENPVDAAWLDIEMPEMNGIELAKKLRERHPHIVLIFVTSKEEYCSMAMRMKADAYIFKPYEMEDIKEAAERTRLLNKRRYMKLRAVMFGRFDIFVNNIALHFPNTKSKELLALCLDHCGGEVTMEEAIDKLWPEKDYDERVKRLYRKAVSSLKTVLAEATDKTVFTNNRGSCKIIPGYFQCDYYELLERQESEERIQEAMEKYLEEYSWSEEIVSSYRRA